MNSGYKYFTVYSKIWDDKKIKQLSTEAKLFFIYCLTSKHTNFLGLFHLPQLYIQADLNFEPKQIANIINELEKNKLILYDRESEVILIVNYIKYHQLNSKQLKGTIPIIVDIPDTYLFQTLYNILNALNNPVYDSLLDALQKRIDTLSIPYRYPIDTLSIGNQDEKKQQKNKNSGSDLKQIRPVLQQLRRIDVNLYRYVISKPIRYPIDTLSIPYPYPIDRISKIINININKDIIKNIISNRAKATSEVLFEEVETEGKDQKTEKKKQKKQEPPSSLKKVADYLRATFDKKLANSLMARLMKAKKNQFNDVFEFLDYILFVKQKIGVKDVHEWLNSAPDPGAVLFFWLNAKDLWSEFRRYEAEQIKKEGKDILGYLRKIEEVHDEILG